MFATQALLQTPKNAVRVSRLRTGTYRGLLSAIWVLVAQWLERLTGDQKVAGSIPVWDSETFFWVCNKAWVANSFPSKILIFNIFFEKNKKLPPHTDETLHVPKWPVFWVVAQHSEKLLVPEVFILSTTLLFSVCKHSLVCLKFSTIYAPVLCKSSHYCPQVYFVLFGSRLVWFRKSLLSGPRQI